jgi:hypothetical protein
MLEVATDLFSDLPVTFAGDEPPTSVENLPQIARWVSLQLAQVSPAKLSKVQDWDKLAVEWALLMQDALANDTDTIGTLLDAGHLDLTCLDTAISVSQE